MFITLILSMVVAAGVVEAGSRGKAKAQEYRARTQAWRRAQQAAWNKRFSEALSAGPKNPLWWPFAAGWVAAGTLAAAGGFGVGAVSGAVAGARSGRKLGQIAGQSGRRFGETFNEWRKANRGQGDVVELDICGRCKGWIRKDRLQHSAEYKQVCPDCAAPSTETPPQWVQAHNDEFERGALSDEPIEVVHERKPGDDGRRCKGCGGLVLGDESLCLECSTRIAWMAERAKAQRTPFRCDRCGTPVSASPRCGPCAEEAAAENRRKREQAEQAAKAEQEKNGPIRVTAERIYPEEPQQKEIAMTYALNAGPGVDVDTSGEALAGIKASLEVLTSQSRTTAGKLVDLTDSMSGKNFAAADLSAIADAISSFEAAVSGLERASERIREHDGVDTAAAELGSDRMADSSVYGQG